MMTRKIYRYTFEDGYFYDSGKNSKDEIAWEEIKHGKLLHIHELRPGGVMIKIK